jgi:hypothetical protein
MIFAEWFSIPKYAKLMVLHSQIGGINGSPLVYEYDFRRLVLHSQIGGINGIELNFLWQFVLQDKRSTLQYPRLSQIWEGILQCKLFLKAIHIPIENK